MFLGISGSSISVKFFFSITDLSVRSSKLGNTSSDFKSFIGLAGQTFVVFEEQTL